MQRFKTKLFVATIVVVAFCTVVGMKATDPSIAELQMMYINMLEKFDKEAWVDSDGDVQFKHEEKTYFINVDENDVEFFRVTLANIWPIENELEKLKVLKALDQANAKTKVAKGHLVNDNVWVSTEMFCAVEDHEDHFERCLRVIGLFIEYYKTEME